MFDLRGTPAQRALASGAITRCDFPFNRLAPQLRSESGRDRIVITWADLTQPRTDDYRARKLRPDIATRHHESGPEHRKRVLGEAWTDGLVRIDTSVETDPRLAHEVVLSELAHQVDFHLLDDGHRERIWDAYHATVDSSIGQHGHGWFDTGGYETWVGESFMGGFTRAYSDLAVSLEQFTHATTDTVARRIREIITPQLGPPPWDRPENPAPDPDPEPKPEPADPEPAPKPSVPWWQRLLSWLAHLLQGGAR